MPFEPNPGPSFNPGFPTALGRAVRRHRGALVVVAVLAGLVAGSGCERDTPTSAGGNAPQEELPQIAAELFGLQAATDGRGATLAWTWPEKDRYSAIEIQRRAADTGQIYAVSERLGAGHDVHIDRDVQSDARYEYRIRCFDGEGAGAAVSPWVTVTTPAEPLLTVNGGEPVSGEAQVGVELLATHASEMRVAVDADPETADWQPIARSFHVAIGASGAHVLACQVRQGEEISEVVSGEVVVDLTDPLPTFVFQLDPRNRSVHVDASQTTDGEGVCTKDDLIFAWSWGDETTKAWRGVSSGDHAYAEPGIYTVMLTVYDWVGHRASCSASIDLSNRPPVAPLLQLPEDGDADASRLPLLQWSGPTDPEDDDVVYTLHLGPQDPPSVQASGLSGSRWEPESPLMPETTYHWFVTATDTWGAAATSGTRTFTTAANSAPAIPDDPYPQDWQERTSNWPRLSWSPCIDPEGSADVRYDLYFGSRLPLPLLAADLTETGYELDLLEHNTTYLWRIVARDAEGAESVSRTWRFTTGRPTTVPLATAVRGAFEMGSDASPDGNPPHHVQLSRSFWIGSHEVTHAQYVGMLMRAVARLAVSFEAGMVVADGRILLDLNVEGCRIVRRGQGFGVQAGFEDAPVVGVTWFGAAAFCDWINDQEGLPHSYQDADGGGGSWELAGGSPATTPGYRLPTEAEWEYVTQRAGASTYPWGEETPDCALANFDGCLGEPAPVGAYPPATSPTGEALFDLAGNVAEWCHDWWSDNLGAADQVDPAGPATGTQKLVRGGSFASPPQALRCAARASAPADAALGTVGFRIARTGGY